MFVKGTFVVNNPNLILTLNASKVKGNEEAAQKKPQKTITREQKKTKQE